MNHLLTMDSIIPIEAKVMEILDTPRTGDDILDHLDDKTINLDNTLNLLRRKKSIISYLDAKTRKFVNLESAIESIFERLDKIEKWIDKTGK